MEQKTKLMIGYILMGLCLLATILLYYEYKGYTDDCSKCLADNCPYYNYVIVDPHSIVSMP